MIEEKLKELKISLPNAPKPVGSYVPILINDKVAYVSGQIPIVNGKVVHSGKVPTEQTLEQAQEASRICIINALAQLKSELGELDKISKIIRVSGYVNAANDFTDHPKVLNSASDLLVEIFGEKGKHSRIAIGVASLPLNSTVEIDLIAKIE